MKEKLRNSGIDSIGNIPWGTHSCQFYKTKEDLMDTLVPYFKAGLENNELCIWIISEPLNIEEVKKALKRAVPDFDIYLEKGQIEIIPCTDWYLKKGVFNSERDLNDWVEKFSQVRTNGYDGMRATENTCWLEKEYWNKFVDYEERLDSIVNKSQMLFLCTYCLEELNITETIDVISNHQISLIKKKGKWEQIENSRQKKITERKQAKRVLYASEERYRSLYENSLDGILLTRPDGTILSANPQACYLFGMTEDEVIQAGREDLAVRDERLAAALEERELTGRAKAELTFKRKNGSTFVSETSSSFFKDADGSIKTNIIIRDITERKRAEEAQKKVHDNLEELVKERTIQLEKAYNSLKESKKGLAEAQKMAHIGNWDLDLVTDKVYWSDETYHIFGLIPQEFDLT
jgi:PAS domain S-box-containing protein